MLLEVKVGIPVYYKPKFGKLENGIIKSLCDDPKYVFVVYNCNNDWEDYRNYTAARTLLTDLYDGWVDKDGRTPLHQELAELKVFGLAEDL